MMNDSVIIRSKFQILEISEILSQVPNLHLNWDLISSWLLPQKFLPDLENEKNFENKIQKTLQFWIQHRGNSAQFQELLDILEKYNRNAKDTLLEKFDPSKDYEDGLTQNPTIKEFWRVPARNKNFTGREKILQNLESNLNFEEIKNSTLNFVLIALGGSGKTSIATEFIYRNKSKFENIFWFYAEKKSNLVEQFYELGTKFNLYNAKEENKENFVTNFIENWFQKNQNWLIIFDNVDGYSNIKDFIPKFGGYVIITSRNINWTNAIEIQIDGFENEESFDLIQKILGMERKKEDLNKIIEVVGNLPLSLAQSCYELKATKIPILKYVEDYQKNLKTNLSKCSEFEDKSVYICFKISLDKIQSLNSLAAECLQFFSTLLPDNISEILLEEFLNCRNLLGELTKVQGIILKYNLVKMNEINGKNYFSMHRLVQKVIKLLNEENEFQILCNSAEILYSTCKKYPELNKFQLLQHSTSALLNLIEFTKKLALNQNKNRSRNLLNRFSDDIIRQDPYIYLDKIKKLNIIIWNNSVILDKWLSEIKDLDLIFESYFVSVKDILTDDLYLYRLNYRMADCFYVKNNYVKSIEFYEQALKLTKNDSDIANIYNNLGVCHYYLRDFEKSREFYEKCLEIEIKLYGENNSELATVHSNLGLTSLQLGNLNGAKDYLEKALQLDNKVFGENNIQSSYTLMNLGDLYHKIGEFQKSSEFHEKGLQIKINFYGEKSKIISKRLIEFGDFYKEIDPSKALKFFNQLAQIEERNFNSVSDNTRNQIQICIQKQNKNE